MKMCVFLSHFACLLHHSNKVVICPFISRLEVGMPDLNYCRLYQKLQVSHNNKLRLAEENQWHFAFLIQMLNCCIKHKQTGASGPPAVAAEEDEFFDAVEETMESMDEHRHSAWNQPQGRKERTKMKLLRSGETLYEPVTQESLPMTEDMVEEQAEMMEQLGDNAQGSELRARILSASLLSDMEAFKVRIDNHFHVRSLPSMFTYRFRSRPLKTILGFIRHFWPIINIETKRTLWAFII